MWKYICYHKEYVHDALSPIFTKHGLEQNGRHFAEDILNAFLWKKMFVSLFKFHCSLFLSVQLIIRFHRFRQWLGAEQATKHYLDQWWLNSLTSCSVARSQSVDYILPMSNLPINQQNICVCVANNSNNVVWYILLPSTPQFDVDSYKSS